MKANIIASEAILAYKSGKMVSVVCSYKKAVKILKALISLDDTKIMSVSVHNPEWDNYDEVLSFPSRSSPMIFDRPKSRILTVPSWSNMILSGLMSR